MANLSERKTPLEHYIGETERLTRQKQELLEVLEDIKHTTATMFGRKDRLSTIERCYAIAYDAIIKAKREG